MRFHISRWRYWWGYAVVFLLVLLAIWFTDLAADTASWITGSIAIVIFLVFEFLIRLERIKITEADVKIIKGVFTRSTTHLSYSSIAGVSSIQTLLQKILRFGNVKIDTPGSEIVLLSYQDPPKIEKAISTYLHKLHEMHAHHAGRPHVGP